ncbi:hypothetical protein LguiA_033904 [Lonicera macranthoides]
MGEALTVSGRIGANPIRHDKLTGRREFDNHINVSRTQKDKAVDANYNLGPDIRKEFAEFALMGMFLNMFGLGAMIIAFITRTYAVLHYSSGIAIATRVVASCIFLIHGVLLNKFFNVALKI